MNHLILTLVLLLGVAQAQRIPARCRAPIAASQLADCCRDFQVGCLPLDAACTTFSQVANVAPAACASGLVCLITDLGLIAADVPNSGACTRLDARPAQCSIGVCTATGADTPCRFNGLTVTCRAWATLDPPEGPDCAFFCTLECRIDGPFASNGVRFCTDCQLRSASCASGFELFGPVDPPVATSPPPTTRVVSTTVDRNLDCSGNVDIFQRPDCCRLTGRFCIPEGGVCTRSGGLIAPIPCRSGLTCVLFDFGNPPVDLPDSGNCRRLAVSPPPTCSIDMCALTGADTVCNFRGTPITCGLFATTPGLDCNLICPAICRVPRLVASNGQLFCSQCVLNGASCLAGFSFFGPVDSDQACRGDIAPAMAAECCETNKIGCLSSGDTCSTAGSRIRPVPCAEGLVCVISDFGLPAVDRPNRGMCRRGSAMPRNCSVSLCASRGANARCTASDVRVVTTCGAWARRSDRGVRPNCDLSCSRRCLPKRRRPAATNGRRFCNLCTLRRASCRRDFRIFLRR